MDKHAKAAAAADKASSNTPSVNVSVPPAPIVPRNPFVVGSVPGPLTPLPYSGHFISQINKRYDDFFDLVDVFFGDRSPKPPEYWIPRHEQIVNGLSEIKLNPSTFALWPGRHTRPHAVELARELIADESLVFKPTSAFLRKYGFIKDISPPEQQLANMAPASNAQSKGGELSPPPDDTEDALADVTLGASNSNQQLNAPSVERNYRQKCIELKRRIREIEDTNDEYNKRSLRLTRGIQKTRLERAFLFEQGARRTLEHVEDSDGTPSPPPSVCFS